MTQKVTPMKVRIVVLEKELKELQDRNKMLDDGLTAAIDELKKTQAVADDRSSMYRSLYDKYDALQVQHHELVSKQRELIRREDRYEAVIDFMTEHSE